jgi:hypothetical protein
MTDYTPLSRDILEAIGGRYRDAISYRALKLINAFRDGQLPPALMASPPTVSESTDVATTGKSRLTGGDYTSGFDLNGQFVRPLGGGFPAGSTPILARANHFGGGFGIATNSDAFEFYSRSGLYTVLVRNQATRLWEKINADEYNTSTGDKVQLIDFGSFADREIRVHSGDISQMSSVKVRPTYDVFPLRRRPRVFVMGDSYVEYKGTLSPVAIPLGGWASRMGLYAGWDVIPAGKGGEGYTASASGRYRTRIPQIANYVSDLDLIMLTGGYNDTSATDAAMTLAVSEDIQLARSYAPDTMIVVTAPFTSSDAADTKVAAVAAGVAAAIAAGVKNVYYIDTVAKRFMTGTDRTNATKSGFVTLSAPLVAGTNATLSAPFAGLGGSDTYTAYFDDGTTKTATFTTGATTMTWTGNGAVTAGVKVFYAKTIPTIAGNFGRIRDSGAHMSQYGHDEMGIRYAMAVYDLLYSLVV